MPPTKLAEAGLNRLGFGRCKFFTRPSPKNLAGDGLQGRGGSAEAQADLLAARKETQRLRLPAGGGCFDQDTGGPFQGGGGPTHGGRGSRGGKHFESELCHKAGAAPAGDE